MQQLLRRVLIACFLIVLPVSALAQELAATLTGTVTDASGAVIAGAKVEITNSANKGAPRVVTTDSHGSFTATNLTPSTYSVMVVAPGFKSYTADNVTLFVAQKRNVSAMLQPGSVNQTVTVQENAVSVDTTTSEQAGTVSGKQVRELELNNRNFEQLVTLQPGVVSGLPDEVGFGTGQRDCRLCERST